LRALLGQATGFYFSGSATSTGDTTSLIDTKVMRYDTGKLTNLWALMLVCTQTSIQGTSRRVSSSIASSGDMTLVNALAATTTSADTYELLPYDPEIMQAAIQEAIRTVWPKPFPGSRAPKGLYRSDPDETLMVDNLLLNPSFETSTTGPVAFTNWTSIGSPTLATDTSLRVHGTQSARIDATGATEGLEQNILSRVDIADAAGKTLHVRGWLWALTADIARLRVTFNGTTFTNGPYHQGGGDWESPSTQKIDVAIPAETTTAQEMTISAEVAESGTALVRVDLVVAWIDPIAEYTMPAAFYPNGPSRVLQQVYEDKPEGLYLPITTPIPGRILRLTGAGRLTVPTTDAGTTEVDENEAELIIAEAAKHMFAMLGDKDKSQEWERKANELRASVGHLLPGADEHTYWHVSGDATRKLVLARR